MICIHFLSVRWAFSDFLPLSFVCSHKLIGCSSLSSHHKLVTHHSCTNLRLIYSICLLHWYYTKIWALPPLELLPTHLFSLGYNSTDSMIASKEQVIISERFLGMDVFIVSCQLNSYTHTMVIAKVQLIFKLWLVKKLWVRLNSNV